jgi:hypothetical protein
MSLLYKRLGLYESSLLNYHQMVLILEGFCYVIKALANYHENGLLVNIWNSIKTKSS